jgi:hypothetical protein
MTKSFLFHKTFAIITVFAIVFSFYTIPAIKHVSAFDCITDLTSSSPAASAESCAAGGELQFPFLGGRHHSLC